MRIACLHTHPDNVRHFEAACPEGIRLVHHVRSDLLARTDDSGVAAELEMIVARLGKTSEAVLLTCSSLRTVLNGAGYSADALMAEEAGRLAAGKVLEVFYTNPGSAGPTTALFAGLVGPEKVRVSLIEGVWSLLFEGDTAEYFHRIAEAADASGADVVAFAQASMTPATEFCRREVLNVPQSAMTWLGGHLADQVEEA